MAPKNDSASVDNTTFLLSCLINAEKLPWDQIATINGISGTDAVPAGRSAQRKFKKLVDASGKFVLDGGKVILKDQLTADEDEDDNDDTASAGDATTTTPKTTPAKKRGRPVGSTKAATKSNKKAKVTKTEETTEGDDEEAN